MGYSLEIGQSQGDATDVTLLTFGLGVWIVPVSLMEETKEPW